MRVKLSLGINWRCKRQETVTSMITRLEISIFTRNLRLKFGRQSTKKAATKRLFVSSHGQPDPRLYSLYCHLDILSF
jgi:hypothetical protein